MKWNTRKGGKLCDALHLEGRRTSCQSFCAVWPLCTCRNCHFYFWSIWPNDLEHASPVALRTGDTCSRCSSSRSWSISPFLTCDLFTVDTLRHAVTLSFDLADTLKSSRFYCQRSRSQSCPISHCLCPIVLLCSVSLTTCWTFSSCARRLLPMTMLRSYIIIIIIIITITAFV